MSTIVTRAGKGSPLTHTEVDANFTNLDTDKLEVGAAFNAAVAATPAVTANTAKVTNATHTGDVTGATALTLATVNANVGAFGSATQVATFTVNAKGLTTAAANVSISIPMTAISDSTAAGRAVLGAASATAQTALFDVFTSGAKGLAPASGGGTTNFLRADGTWAAPSGGGTITESIIVAVGDEVSPLEAGTAQVTFRMPYAMTLTGVRASLTTAQASGSIFTVDINEAGTTILSTKLTIDNTEKTSTTATTAAVISDTALADDAEITIDIDQIGDGTAVGLKVVLIGHQ